MPVKRRRPSRPRLDLTRKYAVPRPLRCSYPFDLHRVALAQESRSDASSSREDAADKAAFQAVCGSCHPLTMVDGLRTESEWLQEIEQMVKIGAKGTDEQFERVIRVLLRTLTKVNVNTATAQEIAPVLDLTDATAEALVKHRTEHGSFKTLEDLKKSSRSGCGKAECAQATNRLLKPR